MCALLLLAWSGAASAGESPAAPDEATTPDSCQRATAGVEEVTPSEPSAAGAGLVLDEHLLTDGSRDQDYDGGGELTFSGPHTSVLGRALDEALGFIDLHTCPDARFAAPGWTSAHALAAGLLVFTPRDLSAQGVTYGDRPYASEFFLSVGRRYTSPSADVAYDSSLTVGVLGLPAAGELGIRRSGGRERSVSVANAPMTALFRK